MGSALAKPLEKIEGLYLNERIPQSSIKEKIPWLRRTPALLENKDIDINLLPIRDPHPEPGGKHVLGAILLFGSVPAQKMGEPAATEQPGENQSPGLDAVLRNVPFSSMVISGARCRFVPSRKRVFSGILATSSCTTGNASGQRSGYS